MTPEIQTYLKTNRIGVLCVTMPNGSPHAATIHYAHAEDPLVIYVATWANSRKCESLINGATVKASFVVGFSEDEMLTLQMDGEVARIVDPEELAQAQAIYYPKHPQGEKFKNSPDTAMLKFVPIWWRFSDYRGPKPRIITE